MSRLLPVTGCLAAALAGFLFSAPASAANLLSDGTFATPALGTAPYSYPAEGGTSTGGGWTTSTVGGWTYDLNSGVGGSGIVNTAVNSNPWYGSQAPSGSTSSQFAFIQRTGTLLSDIFTAPTNGTYDISWLEAGRPLSGMGDETYEVLLGNSVLGTYSTVTGQNFTSELIAANLLAGQQYTLSFTGLTAQDETAFIADARVSSVPLPAALPLFLSALAGLTGFTRRKKATVAV